MNSIKINSTFCIIITILYKVGIWTIHEESKYREMGRKFFYIFSFLFFQILIALFAFLSDDRNQSLFLIELVIGVMVLNVKLIYLLWKKNEIFEFLNDSVIANSILEREGKSYANKIQVFMKFVLAYNFFVIVTGISLVISSLPFFSSEKKLPLFIIIPVDGIVVYWVTYIILAWGIIFSCLSNLNISFIWYIMLNYSIKYQILRSEFRNLGATRTTQKATEAGKKFTTQNQNLFLQDFVVLVNKHRNLSEY